MEWPCFPKFLSSPGTKGHVGDHRSHGIKREVVIFFSACVSYAVCNSPLGVSHQLRKSHIYHWWLEVTMLSCWELLVTQAEWLRSFLCVYPRHAPEVRRGSKNRVLSEPADFLTSCHVSQGRFSWGAAWDYFLWESGKLLLWPFLHALPKIANNLLPALVSL